VVENVKRQDNVRDDTSDARAFFSFLEAKGDNERWKGGPGSGTKVYLRELVR